MPPLDARPELRSRQIRRLCGRHPILALLCLPELQLPETDPQRLELSLRVGDLELVAAFNKHAVDDLGRKTPVPEQQPE